MIKLITSLLLFSAMLSTLHAHNASPTVPDKLSEKQITLIPIASFTAIGDLEKLDKALHAGLDAGWTINELKEAMIHLYAYAGFPRSIRGLQTLMHVLEQRKLKQINDPIGNEATKTDDQRSRYIRGKTILEELSGNKENDIKTGYQAFAPQIEIFLKEHLFADLFERNVLSYIDRELITIAVLSSLGGLEPMLMGHMRICLHIGLTADQLSEFARIIGTVAGREAHSSSSNVLLSILRP